MSKELAFAIKAKNIDVVQRLLDEGVNLNPQKTIFNFWKKIELPLNLAIGTQCIELVKLLLEHGADVECYDYLGAPLQFACYCDSIKIVKLLLEYNADVDFYVKTDPPVAIACYQDKVSLLKILLDHDVDTSCLWSYEWSRFSFDIMQTLVDRCDTVPDGLRKIYNREKS